MSVCQAEGDPSKNPGHWASRELLWLHTPHVLSHLTAGRTRPTRGAAPGGPLERALASWTCPCVSFSLPLAPGLPQLQ